MERRRIIAVASALAAIVVVVFVLSAQDTSVVREQGAATTSMPNGMRLAGTVSETVPEHVQAETSPASVLLEDELTPATTEHPADLDQGVWSKYTAAKDNAEVTVPADEFRAMEDSCMHTRKHAALDCGQLYCAAEAECGKPCEKLYGMPPVQVVPLQPGGPKFHRVAEVDRKERANKELHAKEVAAKERAVKEHAEKAKEKAAKEVNYKKKLDEEKSSKESTMKAHAAEEASTKHGLEGEISMKENQVKMNFTAMETYVSNNCVVEGQTARVKCDEEKQEKLAEEIATKEVAIKAAQAKNESDQEDVYAVGNGTAELHDLAGDIGHSEAIIGNASTAGPHLYNPAGADTVSPTPAPTSHCDIIATSIDCIASYGCHYDVDASRCVDGFIPGEFVNGTETEQQIESWDPLSVLENCVNDDTWGNGEGLTCDEVDAAYCQEHGSETFPGFGCDADGTGCKTAIEACCTCQIVFSSATAQCTDDASFRNQEGLTCADVSTEWCQLAGNQVYPGIGCAEDGHDCLSGFEACCTCKTGADLAASGKGEGDVTAAESPPTSSPTSPPTIEDDEDEEAPSEAPSCPAATFNNGEGTPTAPECESCSQLQPPCDDCDCPDFTFTFEQNGYDVKAACTAACLTPGYTQTGIFSTAAMVATKKVTTETVHYDAMPSPKDAQSKAMMTDVLKLLKGVTPDRRLLQHDDVVGAPIPTAAEIESLEDATDDKIEASNKAAASTDTAAGRDLDHVANMVAIANNATLQSLEREAEHNEDVTAAGMYSDLITGLDATSDDVDADAANRSSALVGGDEPACATVQHDANLQCHIDSAAELKANLTKMNEAAQDEHKHFLDEAAEAADRWGAALKHAQDTQAALEAAEKEAADDLAKHIALQPYAPTLAMMQAQDDGDKCDTARDTAYQHCRDSQNEAYQTCYGIFAGEIEASAVPALPAPAPPVATGSGASAVDAFLAGTMLEKGHNFKNSMLKPEHHAAPARKVDPATEKLLNRFDEPTSEQLDAEYSEPASEDTVLKLQNQMYNGNYDDSLLQEGDSALKSMGYPFRGFN